MSVLQEYQQLFNEYKDDPSEERREQVNALFASANREEQRQITDWMFEKFPPETTFDEIPGVEIPEDIPLPERPAVPESFPEPSRTPYDEEMSVAGRKRAYRANMLRKIKRRFGYMQLFTVEDAAIATKTDRRQIAQYLVEEASKAGTQIGYNFELKKYFTKSP